MRYGRLSARTVALAVLALALTTTSASAQPRDARLRDVHTWAFAIGDGDLSGNLVERYAGYELVVIDGQEATATQVRRLRRAGAIVLAYLDVGTIEPGRPWYSAAKRYRLDYWPDWGEWYANVDSRGYRTLLLRRVAPVLLHKGFNGLFLDNTDMIETHPRQVHGMRTLVRETALLVHRRGMLLFTQNGEDSIGPTLRYFDGWNREDVTATYDFSRRRYVLQSAAALSAAQRALRRIGRAGLLTLATDYTAAGDTATAALAVSNACVAGALPFFSDIALARIPSMPPRCS